MRYYISKFSIYIFLFCFFYLIQRFVAITLIKFPRILCWNTIYLHEILFTITSVTIVKTCFHIDRPE